MRQIRALVIDDSRIMRTMIMHSLCKTELAEFEFTEAEDGLDAISKFDPNEIDIVFADWNMPNMNGIEFVEAIRANRKNRHIPIIMVTSEKTMHKMEVALDEAGADAYICKPFTVDDLERKVGRFIKNIGKQPEKPAGFFSKLMGGGG